jgi:exosortase K
MFGKGNKVAQLIVILLGTLTLKQFYSTANVNELRWILAPTTVLVELVSGLRFEFESYAGYINSDRSFIIAASCAGVNFLLTAFLMLSLGKLWRDRARSIPWRFIPVAVVFAYLTTLVANTVRIAIALRLRAIFSGIVGLDANQLHRVEGICVYFGFLLVLYGVSEKMSRRTGCDSHQMLTLDRKMQSSGDGASSLSRNLLRQSFFPLLIYYATMLGIPLANAAHHPSVIATDFWQHLLFVLLTPLVVIIPVAVFRLFRRYRVQRDRALALPSVTALRQSVESHS